MFGWKTEKELKEELQTLKDENSRLCVERNRLKDLNADLHMQCQTLRAAKPMTDIERQELDRKMEEHTRLVQEQSNIIVFLRNHSPEVLKGEFSNLPFDKFIIKLLGG